MSLPQAFLQINTFLFLASLADQIVCKSVLTPVPLEDNSACHCNPSGISSTTKPLNVNKPQGYSDKP